MESSEPTSRDPRRTRVRKVGMSGNHWYAVELSRNLRRNEVKEAVFWKTSIALFRGDDGVVRAVENRCAHRQLRLSEGRVEGNFVVCQYHGWKYNGCGKCVHVSHELGKGRTALPDIQVRGYPVKERWGFVWLFPGNPELAEATPLPHIPQLEGADAWPFFPIDITIKAHFSMIVENVCDFNHEYLHKWMQPFSRPTLREFNRSDEGIVVDYDTHVGGPIGKFFAERGGQGLDHMRLWYQYPYQGSDTKGKYLHWLFMVPIDEQTTRCFFVFLFGPIEIPALKLRMPELFRRPILKATNDLWIVPLLRQDQWALEEEQRAFKIHGHKPSVELNPIIPEFQKLTIDRWDAYVQGERERMRQPGHGRFHALSLGAGIGQQELGREGTAELAV